MNTKFLSRCFKRLDSVKDREILYIDSEEMQKLIEKARQENYHFLNLSNAIVTYKAFQLLLRADTQFSCLNLTKTRVSEPNGGYYLLADKHLNALAKKSGFLVLNVTGNEISKEGANMVATNLAFFGTTVGDDIRRVTLPEEVIQCLLDIAQLRVAPKLANLYHDLPQLLITLPNEMVEEVIRQYATQKLGEKNDSDWAKKLYRAIFEAYNVMNVGTFNMLNRATTSFNINCRQAFFFRKPSNGSFTSKTDDQHPVFTMKLSNGV